MKGVPVHPKYTTKGLKLKHSEETKQKLKLAVKNRISKYCNCCNKTITGNMNWDRHIKSKIHLSQYSNQVFIESFLKNSNESSSSSEPTE